MYLSTDSLGVVIVSAKSSEMNVLIPSDGDFVSVHKRLWIPGQNISSCFF